MSEKWDKLAARFEHSPYATLLGMKVEEVAHGYGRVSLTVRPEYEWEQRTHGGLIMSLADHAFACATNSLDRVFVAAQLNFNFLSSPVVGETIFAEARVVHAGKTLGLAEIVVQNSGGKVIARATGMVVAVGT